MYLVEYGIMLKPTSTALKSSRQKYPGIYQPWHLTDTNFKDFSSTISKTKIAFFFNYLEFQGWLKWDKQNEVVDIQ